MTNAFRLIHGASDGWPGWYVDRLGEYLLSQSEEALNQAQMEELKRLQAKRHTRASYHKVLSRRTADRAGKEAAPKLVRGEAAREPFVVRENGVQFELNFNEGYSVGLFLDQRDNRRRILSNHIAAGFELFDFGSGLPEQGSLDEVQKPEVLNAFAYTCGFSVCAAKAGAQVTSLDLSKKYLEWGKRNFELNDLAPSQHDFIFGDVLDWLARFTKKGRRFNTVLLDPPTCSRSKESGIFRAEQDYPGLVQAALRVLKPAGILFCSTNAGDWPAAEFVAAVEGVIKTGGRKIGAKYYAPQPPDFPITRDEPGYLKTVWLR